MKPFISLLSAICFVLQVQGQNLVPNHSFEQYSNCPTGNSQVTNYCSGWVQYTTGTSDYYHVCTSSPLVDVPANILGYQDAEDGNAYVGFFEYVPQADQREYISAAITPMQVGKLYEVSMSVSLGDSCQYASNGLGAYFFDSGPAFVMGYLMLQRTPQVSYTSYGPITSKTSWTRLTGYMLADSAYDNIVLGGFVPYSNLQTTYLGGGSVNFPTSYYYVDSVVVRRVNNMIDISLDDSLLCAGDTITVDYSVLVKCFPGNVFTAQLSNPSGSFSAPVNIGTVSSDSSGTITCVIPANTSNGTGYRIRLISSQFADTSADNGFNIKIGNIDSVTVTTSHNTPVCEGSTVMLAAGSSILSSTFSWLGPNGFNSNVQSPAISNATTGNSGSYYATVKFYGCTVKDTVTVVVKPMPAKPVAGSNSPLCAGDTLALSLSGITTGAAYTWTGPSNFTSSVQTPSILNTVPAMSGSYIVSANLNGCIKADTTAVLINYKPDTVTLATNAPICAGDTLKLFSDTSSPGVVYLWNGPGNFTAGTQNSGISNATASATGWYKMTVDLNGCVFKDSIYAVVNPLPSALSLSYNQPLCQGEHLQLSANAVTGGVYSWTGPGNFSSAQQSPVRNNVQFGDTGTYKAKVTVNGCSSAESSISVKANPVPFVVILPTPSDSICQGDMAMFTALPNNHGGSPSYQWYVNTQPVGTGASFSTSSLNNGDLVRCYMTENTKCSTPYTDESNYVTMKVLPWLAPSVSITADPNRPLNKDEYVTFTAAPVNAGDNPLFQWKRNGQDIIGATGNTWAANTLNDNDSISVELVSSYKCPQPTTAKSNGIVVRILSHIDNTRSTHGLSLYPNPNNGSFVLAGSKFTPGVTDIKVVDAIGKVIHGEKTTASNGTLHHTVVLGNIPTGVYVVLITTAGEEPAVLRFVKQ